MMLILTHTGQIYQLEYDTDFFDESTQHNSSEIFLKLATHSDGHHFLALTQGGLKLCFHRLIKVQNV